MEDNTNLETMETMDTTEIPEAVEIAEDVIIDAPVEPEAVTEAAPEAAIPEAPVVEAAAPAAPVAQQAQQAQQAPAVQSDKFTQEEMDKIRQYADTIDLEDTGMVLQYGVGAQQKLAEFSESALASVKTKELGEVGDLLVDLVTEIKTSGEEKKGIFGVFKSAEKKLEEKKARYTESEKNVDKIADALQDHQVILLKDIALLDRLYDKNQKYFKELSMYIEAGKIRLQEVRSGELMELQRKAEASKLPEDVQALDDLNSKCERFEKKLYDLELTRTVALQMAPQIRMVQNNDTLMSEKIQSTLVNSLPLWKSQMLLALGLAHSQEAAKAQQIVTDATNQMLIQNAETLKDATITSAKEYERGIVDMETLEKTHASLITTMDEVLKIQDEGRTKRREAESELRRLEDELRQKIMSATAASVNGATGQTQNEPAAPASIKVDASSDDPFGLYVE